METATGKEKQADDPRVAGIATVGWISLAGLGISIPLTAIAGAFSGILAAAIPLTIIFGAGIMAVRIWSSGEKQVNQKENDLLKNRIAELEERLTNLEMVDSLEAHFAQKHQPPEIPSSSPPAPPTMGPGQQSSTS